MKNLYTTILFLFIISVNAQTNYYHDTQGKLEISNSGQATFSLPIALPASIGGVGPTINLVYQSGQFGGIAGQGWSINSVSTISRMATRLSIDGIQDGVDFDSNDKLALDGQRLLLASGTYWADGSTYKTEIQSNTKIELKGSGTTMYFIVTQPDGSRSWYGNYGGTNSTDLSAFFINRFEDTKGNFITYSYNINHYGGVGLCLKEIKFNGNVNGIAATNSILFTYKAAKRNENAYIKGVKFVKAATLDFIEVKTNALLFRKYQFTHITDAQLGYEKVSRVQEFNGALEPANPIDFEYETTQMVNGAELETSYQNNLDFSKIEVAGDFDGDGRLDFTTDTQAFTKLFQSTTGTVFSLPFTIQPKKALAITTLKDNKLNQFQSVANVVETAHYISFNVYDKNPEVAPYVPGFGLNYSKTINIENEGTTTNTSGTCAMYPNGSIYTKNTNEYLEGDFDGNGISEILIVSKNNELRNISWNTADNCKITYTDSGSSFYYLDSNPLASTNIGTSGFSQLSVPTGYLDGKRYVMDFNGDGRSDILCLKPTGAYYLLSINKLTVAPWVQLELLGNGTIDKYTDSKQILFGDFNGDSKADIMLPDVDGEGCKDCTGWHIYYCNPNPAGGSFFTKQSFDIVEYWGNSGTYYNTQTHYSTYYAMDTNKDGKSDLVRVWRKNYKPGFTVNDHNTQWTVTSFANNIGNAAAGNGFTQDYTSLYNHDSDNNWMPIPISSTYNYQGLNRELVIVQNQDNTINYINFGKDVAKENLLKKVTQSGGAIVDEIEYSSLEPSAANAGYGNLNDFYSSTNSMTYPYVEIKRVPGTLLVSKIKNTALGITKYQDFKYNGFIVNMDGIGALGFKKTARCSWYRSSADKKIWSVSENDPTKRGALVQSYAQLLNGGVDFYFMASGLPSDALNSTVNTYFPVTVVNGLYTLLLDKQTTNDFLTNVKVETNYEYLAPYNLPKTVTTKNYLGSVLEGTTIVTNEFDNNNTGVGSAYYIGRPNKITTKKLAYSDTVENEEKLSYDTKGNILKTEKKPTSATYYLTEAFEYDAYGNVKKKTISAPGAVPVVDPRVTEYKYDPTARYVIESKDVEAMVTKFTYDTLYGNVLTETDPYNLVTTSVYDNWGKRTKVTDFLGKKIDYTYTKSNNLYTTTQVGEDGSLSTVISNALAQVVKKGKLLIDGQWSYSTIEYDYLGRKLRESEPFTGSSPSLWTTVTYDDYGRTIKNVEPTSKTTNYIYDGLTVTSNDGIKTTVTVKNSNDHVISATDNGGAIAYSYYANGNLKNADYAGTVVEMTYDLWGRKSTLKDPSAGEYSYSYNAFGELLTETTPNGTTTNTIDAVGKVTLKKIVGNLTNSQTTYTFDGTTKLLTGIKQEDFIENTVTNYTYGYDQYKRLNSKEESGPENYFQQMIEFDGFGRPLKELYTARNITANKTSSKWVKYTYKNGYKWQILDNDTPTLILWQATTVNAKGQLATASYGNGITVTNTYDQYGFPTQIKHDKAGVNTMTLNTSFYQYTGNLTSRSNSMFGTSEVFTYDNLDRLTQWGSVPVELFLLTFAKFSNHGFVGVNGGSVTITNDRLVIQGTTSRPGARKLIASNLVLGTRLNINVDVYKNTTDVIIPMGIPVNPETIRMLIIEEDPATGATTETLLSNIYESNNYQTEYKTIKNNFNVYIQFDKDIPGSPAATKTFAIDNLRITKQAIETQAYDDSGRITENRLGQYDYGDSNKAYQNTSVQLEKESEAYYTTREGIFFDTMESNQGWIDYSGTLSYDCTKAHTGNMSLKITNPDTTEKVNNSDKWVAIDNAVATNYTYSGWVYSNGPSVDIWLFMKTATETGYYSAVDAKSVSLTGQLNQWVYVEKTFSVPANIKFLNMRLDNNSQGTVWYDDVKIRKTANPVPTGTKALNITYNVFKSPVEINEPGNDRINFAYNLNNDRSAMYYGSMDADKSLRPLRKYYDASGTMEIKRNTQTGTIEFITYIGGDGYTAPVVLKSDGITQEYLYLHRDHQGSIVAVSNQAGNVVEKRLFDPWGNVLKVQDGAGNILPGLTVLDRGYTGHEHLQTVGLINMNARLYDPKLHRFLQPDNFVQDPYNTQSFNRYGYCWNNPLKYEDPSGEIIPAILVAVIIGSAVSALTYTITALLADVPFTVGGLIQATVIGAYSSAMTFGIGTAVESIGNFYVQAAVAAVAHGTFQGAMTGVSGGNFWSGFAAGAVSSIASSAWSGGPSYDKAGQEIYGSGMKGIGAGTGDFGMVAFGTVMGGAASSLTGGNFWQGAVTGLFVSGLNHAMHKIGNNDNMFVDDDQQQQGKEVTLKSLGINSKDSAETIINKIMSGMKPGDYASGDMFSFINSDVGDYIKTVTRIDANNFKITTKGILTGAALKNNSTLTISKANIAALKITGTYKISINGLTSLGKGQIYQNVWVNDNMRYMYDNNKWLQAKVK